MKKAICTFAAVLVAGFLAVSCGGGNVNKVKNGVFSDYDNTITVGEALENNSTLKGGEWGTVEMDGRDFVTYTVKMTGEQIQAILPEWIEDSDWTLKGKTNYGVASNFLKNLSLWKGQSAEILNEITSMSGEEVNQAWEIFNTAAGKYNATMGIGGSNRWMRFVEPYPLNGNMLIDKYYGAWFLEHVNDFTDSDGRGISPDEVKCYYRTILYDKEDIDGEYVQNGMFVEGSALAEAYRYSFSDTNFFDSIELQKDIAVSYLQLCADYEKAIETGEAFKKELEDNPMLTVDGYEIILSLVMNEDDSFTTNMMESYTEVTLNCFDNLKVRFAAGRSENAQSILNYIYQGFTPDFF